jgi:hypothetical protein
MKKVLALILFAVLAFVGINAQGTTQRIALLNLQKGNIVESSRAGQIGLTDNAGNQRYAQYTEIDLVPITYTPTTTGNTQNYSEFVTTTGGDIWYIDWQGRGLRIYTPASADAGDYDWLEIGNNQIPNSIRDSIYTDNYAAINVKLVWPQAQLLVGDSLNAANIVALGNRESRIGFYRLTGPNWSSIGQEGGRLVARLGTNTVGFEVQSSGGISPSQPAAPFRSIVRINKDSSIHLLDFKSTRNDTAAINNILYTDGQGFLKSSPVGELPGGGGGIVLPTQQVGYGTGTGIVSSPAFTYFDSVLTLSGRIELSDSRQNTNMGLAAGSSSGGNTSINLGYVAGQYDSSVYAINIGALAGRNNKGTKLIAIGLNAGRDNTALSAIAIGENALAKNKGLENIAVGAYARGENTTGLRNTVIGVNAGSLNTTGENNTYVGWRAGYGQNGIGNTYVGESANDQSFGGIDNTAIGIQAQHDNYDSDRNTSLGALTLYTLQTVYAADMIAGVEYEIGFPGTTNWTTYGAANNLSRTVFIYNGVTPVTGNGNVRNFRAKSSGNIAIGHHAGYFVGRGNRNVYIGDMSGENTYFWHRSDVLHIENTNSDSSLICGNFAQNKVGINTKVGDLIGNFNVNGTVNLFNLTSKGTNHSSAIFQDPLTGEIASGTGANFALQNGSVAFGTGSNIGEDNASFRWDNTNKRLGIGFPFSITDPLAVNGSVSTNFRYYYRNSSTGNIVGEFGSGANFNNGAASDIGIKVLGTGSLLLGTAGFANSSVIINNSGFVGVGDILNPTYPLHIKRSVKNARFSFWGDNSGGTEIDPNLMGLEFQGGGGFRFGGISVADKQGGVVHGGIGLWCATNVITNDETYRIFADGATGNVSIGLGLGVGTEKLDVNGGARFRGLSTASNNMAVLDVNGVLTNGTPVSDVVTVASTLGGDLSGTFTNAQLVANSVGSAEIATDAVGSSELAASSVGTSEIINGAVGNLDLASQSAANGQILDYKGPGVGWTPSDQTENISLLFDTSLLPNVTGITIPGLRVPANLSGWKLSECNIGVLSPAASGTDYVIRGRVNATVTPNAVFAAGTTHLQPIPGGGGITVATGDLLKLEVVTAGTAIPTGLMCTWTFTKQ